MVHSFSRMRCENRQYSMHLQFTDAACYLVAVYHHVYLLSKSYLLLAESWQGAAPSKAMWKLLQTLEDKGCRPRHRRTLCKKKTFLQCSSPNRSTPSLSDLLASGELCKAFPVILIQLIEYREMKSLALYSQPLQYGTRRSLNKICKKLLNESCVSPLIY